MGLGTALLTSLVAVSSVAARRITVASSGTPASVALASDSSVYVVDMFNDRIQMFLPGP